MFPAASFGAGGVYQFNFGQSPFAYPAPAGFTAGWSNTGQRNFGSFLANGVGAFLSGTQVAVSPYVCGLAGNIQSLIGVGCSGDNTEAVGVIYDSDGAGGGPGTLLGASAATGGGTEVAYALRSSVAAACAAHLLAGRVLRGERADPLDPAGRRGPGGLYVDTTATWPTPNAHFTVSAVEANHLPMLAQFSAAGGGGSGYSFGEII